MGVQILDSLANLHHIAFHLKLVKSLPSSQKLVQRLTLAQLKDDVYVFSILEEMLKADDVGMMKRSMNLDLTHKLLFCS